MHFGFRRDLALSGKGDGGGGTRIFARDALYFCSVAANRCFWTATLRDRLATGWRRVVFRA